MLHVDGASKVLRFRIGLLLQSPTREQIVDPHFPRAPLLNMRDSLLFGEKLIFGKVEVATYFILF